MNKLDKKSWASYVLMIILLFGIPIYTIIVSTDTLKGGKEFLFRVEAFDPYDMFRGNYLAIQFKEDSVKSRKDLQKNRGEVVYVSIREDENGFAYFSDISSERPNGEADYYRTKMNKVLEARDYLGVHTIETYNYAGMYKYIIDTPTRYYMNEDKSLEAEKLFNENVENAYVKVRVKNGKMVIVGVYVNDVLIDSIS